MNDAQKRGLARLMLRWPQRRAELRQKWSRIAGLPALFEAYELTCEAAAHWSKISSPTGHDRAEEYRVLALEIEQEIDDAISQSC